MTSTTDFRVNQIPLPVVEINGRADRLAGHIHEHQVVYRP